MKPTLISVLVMIFTLCGTRAQTVTQPKDHISVLETSPVQVKYNYSYSRSPVLFWYVQYPKQHLQLLPKHISRESIRGFTAHLDKKEASFHLKKPSAQAEDSAVYYCALSDTRTDKLTFGDGTSLTVKPNIKNPDPAVYQLKGPKSNNISVCLYTDFQMNTTKDSEPAVFSLSRTVFNSNTTVLDMGALGSKSNGLVAWSKSTDFECQSTFRQEFYPNSGISCDAKLVEKSFETDMNLNLQNLSVMGFRIILLKMVGFNLLMTLRLWSS
nr:T cell receptor alpha chain [Sus scrofa]